MRVVIITGTAPHHQYLCAELVKACTVVGIIHPAASRPGPVHSIQQAFRRAKRHGWSTVLLQLAGKLLPEPDFRGLDFTAGIDAYKGIPSTLIHADCDIQSTETQALLRSLRPDVMVCLGGPLYPKALIDASPLTLNFHSGISPLYNGTASIPFAFAHGHPHLCGGTLMVMNTKVDGGGILGHYLPEIRSGDSPGTLFEKTVLGAVTMYKRILAHLESPGSSLQQVLQSRPLFYTRGFEFGLPQKTAIARHLRTDIGKQYERAETVAEYWREPTSAAAQQAYYGTLERLLFKSTGSSDHEP